MIPALGVGDPGSNPGTLISLEKLLKHYPRDTLSLYNNKVFKAKWQQRK